MKLLSKYVDQDSLKQYYNSYVLPVFDFGCVIWGNTINANLTRLVKLQKRAAMTILKADLTTSSKQPYKELNWLPFPKRVQYHTCLTVYKSSRIHVIAVYSENKLQHYATAYRNQKSVGEKLGLFRFCKFFMFFFFFFFANTLQPVQKSLFN